MEQIKRNSREFKDVREIIEDYAENATRKRLIKLYALKPFESLNDKILLNEVKENSLILYDLAYESLRDLFRDRGKKLFRENKEPLYYFKSSAKSKWMEFPFELTGKLKKQVFPLKKVK